MGEGTPLLCAIVVEGHLHDAEVPTQYVAVLDHGRHPRVVLVNRSQVVLASYPLARLGILLDVVVMDEILQSVYVTSLERFEEALYGISVLLL
jgi:hypothetical protein